MPEKRIIRLHALERRALTEMTTSGKRPAREIMRAQVLLKRAAGWTEGQVARALSVSERTVRRIRRRAVKAGVLAAVTDKPRSGAPRKLTQEEEAQLVALACSPAPAGRCRWTVRLLTEEAVERGLIGAVAVETVRQVLKKTRSSRGKWRVGVRPRSRRSFSTA